MAQIRNRFDLQNSIADEQITAKKKLPNFFNTTDEIGPFKGITLSIAAHIFFTCVLVLTSAFMGLVFPHLPKPELPNRDVEFKLVQNESKPPINKNTKIRSDRDSRAGGKHDPKRAISEPSPAKSAPAKPKTVQKQQQKVAKAPQKPMQKTVQKPVQKPVQKTVNKPVNKPVVAQKPVAKPSPIKAPTAAKPQARPQTAPKAPTAPRVAAAPKSPFSVPVAPSKAPVGTTYRPPAASGTSGGSSSGRSSSSPAPKFSSAGSSASRGGSSSGSSGSKYASRGSSGGYGSGGNPSPGNPNGAPGIDAIRQPNWGPYMRDLEQRIKRNWSPPKGDSSKRVVITFTIGRDGRLLSHRVTKSSGVPLADRAAMSAIELTAPFRPLPPEFKGQSVPIEFTFDYNVLNSVLR